ACIKWLKQCNYSYAYCDSNTDPPTTTVHTTSNCFALTVMGTSAQTTPTPTPMPTESQCLLPVLSLHFLSSFSLSKGNLLLIQENMTWIEAMGYCREHHIALVHITTKDIQEKVVEKTKHATSSHVWLSLRYTCEFNFWFWTSSATGCYQNWAPGQGSEGEYDCGVSGAIQATGRQQWVGLPETEKLNFICFACPGLRRASDASDDFLIVEKEIFSIEAESLRRRNRSGTMKCYTFSILFLILTMESECSKDRFFISAPGVFHVGVNEKVFVQMEGSHLNNPVTLYLEHELTNSIMSRKETVVCTVGGQIKTVELKVDRILMSHLRQKDDHPYLMLVAEGPSISGRRMSRVLISKRRGNIFIQTDQPIYNPTQIVKYRIFTLDHRYRPTDETFQISIFNAAGNRIINYLKAAERGIRQGSFPIPDVSKAGTWKITAHYEGDETNVVSREFTVKKFVLPSFEVNIEMKQNYILLDDEEFNFTISAKYSHGEEVKGAYHCQFGVLEKDTTGGQKVKPIFIKGLELTGSVQKGAAVVSLQVAKLNEQKQTLSEIQQNGALLYLGVFVTNIQSGEVQEAEVHLPIIRHRFTLDLSRTRPYFLPGYPLDVVAVVRHPDGSPAAGVSVNVAVSPSTEGTYQVTTDQEGAVYPVFNIPNESPITVRVSTEGVQETKEVRRASSKSNSYLYLSIRNKMYSVDEVLSVTYNTFNSPTTGFIYYMVLSRGILITYGSLAIGTSVKDNLVITSDMVPSFHLIGYYFDQHGNIIADSVWVDVRDECEIKVKVETKGPFQPGKLSTLEFDLHGQRAQVALLAVDKAFYGLHADNKLTAKQVFSSMQSHDRGCLYSGGADPASVLTDAGLSFVTQSESKFRKSFGCNPQSPRQRRSVDLEEEKMNLKANFSNEKLKECCGHGFSPIPMRITCQDRARRVSLVEANSDCVDVFLKCCLEGERLRQKKIQEEASKGLGRTAKTADIEQFFFDTAAQYIRRYFPPSFDFIQFDVNGKGSYSLALPDSITTWEIQVVTLSAATGFCVVKPAEVRAFKKTFVSLPLPYSVRKYEQLSISPVIYNYGYDELQVAVHMEQTEGLCSPGSATTTGFVNITVGPQSAQFVSFSAVPMVTGSIPIKIRLYDIENENGIDAVEKPLKVLVRRSSETIPIDGTLPNGIVPDSSGNIFISMEGEGFGGSRVKNLLSPQNVAKLIVLPTGCLEQTMVRLAPTASALRYLDLSEQWFDLPPGSRDDALDKVESGYIRIHTLYKKSDGSYGPWYSVPSSNWWVYVLYCLTIFVIRVTALVVKVLSLVAQRQIAAFGVQGRRPRVVPEEEIRQPVQYLLTVQQSDGSFRDPQPVLHRGVLKGNDQHASMTAFITLALHRSLQFLEPEGRTNAVRMTKLAVLLFGVDFYFSASMKLTFVVLGANPQDVISGQLVPTHRIGRQEMPSQIETTAYALLAAVELKQTKWADKAACWLITQENYYGGYRSSQPQINHQSREVKTCYYLCFYLPRIPSWHWKPLRKPLAEYELQKADNPTTNVIAEFSVPGKTDIIRLALTNKNERVEIDLKKLVGNNINAKLTGTGSTKIKIVKAYHLLKPKDNCDQLSISVTVEGKVKYTAPIIENYDYYDGDDYITEEKDDRVPRSAIEWFDARTRNRRDLDNNLSSDEAVTYRVCVSHNLNNNLTGMAIADITLLSGFEVNKQELDMLKEPPEQYISHYEASYGRVVIYFNELFEPEECISFSAKQIIPIGLLQPAPAVFYDYYEPAYIVEVLNVSTMSNFDLYRTNVKEVLRIHEDNSVGKNSVRVFAQRRQCKGQLDLGKEYLIMGKDGSTTDSNGMMQYLLESNTWVEKKPSEEECKKSARRSACTAFNEFKEEYKIDGCRQ
ncbi:hypothetical protein L3Q82_013149, partial [Scortum barcoo]